MDIVIYTSAIIAVIVDNIAIMSKCKDCNEGVR